MTVKEAVLLVLITYYPKIKNWRVEQAHQQHKMSGTARLRELRNKYGLEYKFNRRLNEYEIQTPYEKLLEINEIVKVKPKRKR
jgi:hypothetical protein